ncbi:MAG: SIS domain-containing protein [Bacteroidales bacterium]|jgi:arabinose-5-phosphate isomerase|nr:SIS domain-containing protein [Bacteroidota bacterium]
MQTRVRQILDQEAEAVRKIPVTESYNQAIELIHKHVHLLKGKLVTSGMGKAGQIAQNIATTFSSTGTPAVFLHPSEARHGDLGVLHENDIMLVISNSGRTREILELIELKNNLFPDMPVVVITGNNSSPLWKGASVGLYTGGPAEVCPLGLTPTTSTTVMTVIGDVLVVLMIEKTGFTAAEYAKRHHGGYLGYKSRECSGNSGETIY